MRGRKPNLKALDGGLTKAPPMPPSLPPEMAPEWQATAADLVGRGLLSPAMLPTLELFLRTLWIQRQAQKAIQSTGIMVPGRAGMKTNPAVGLLAKSTELAGRLAQELGLTPMSRSRPGMKETEAAHAASAGEGWDL